MQVQFFVMTSDTLHYIKDKTLIGSEDCQLKRPLDIENPTVLIRGKKYDKCNYFYIPYFNRYYFVQKCVGVSDDLVELSGLSDVLSSVPIVNLVATVERQEFKRNTQLVDNELIAQANNNFICRQVGDPVNGEYQIYITTCGGEVEVNG